MSQNRTVISDIEKLRRLLKLLARYRASRTAGGALTQAIYRTRRKAFLRRLAAEWPGGAVEHDTGDLLYVPQPLDARGRACLLQPPRAHPVPLRFLHPGAVAIDVGANLGEWTVPMAHAVGAAGRVVSFEPIPLVAEALKRTTRLNNLPQVTIVEAALSDRVGRASLAVPVISSSASDSGRAHLGIAASGEDAIEVATSTLDAALAAAQLSRLDLVKIDVEGHERAVLAGAVGAIGRFRPVLVIEIGHESADDRRAIAAQLSGFGYEMAGVLLDDGLASASWQAYLAAAPPFIAGEVHNLLLLPPNSPSSAHG